MGAKEAKARIKINKLLEAAGWRFFDSDEGPANIQVEANVKITKKQFDDFGENFEKVKNGFIDFLLLDEQGKPFVVLEAKSEDKDPLVGKEQARRYAQSNFVKYVILSNGNIHYFWNIYKGNPQIILGRVGEYCGATHITTAKCWITDNALMATDYYMDIDLKYLWIMLNQLNLRQFAKVGGQPSISQSTVYECSIPLPPLEIQRLIIKSVARNSSLTMQIRIGIIVSLAMKTIPTTT